MCAMLLVRDLRLIAFKHTDTQTHTHGGMVLQHAQRRV